MFPEALVKSWTINGSETERRAFNVTVWVGGGDLGQWNIDGSHAMTVLGRGLPLSASQ